MPGVWGGEDEGLVMQLPLSHPSSSKAPQQTHLQTFVSPGKSPSMVLLHTSPWTEAAQQQDPWEWWALSGGREHRRVPCSCGWLGWEGAASVVKGEQSLLMQVERAVE